MNFIDASIFILFIAILAVPLAIRFRLPLEIFLLLGSCAISMMPGLPNFQINPIIVFNIFLPPILFSAAFATPWQDFKLNIKPISLLAIGLVLFTTTAVAILAHYLLPGFTLAEGFLLGAIVSPTDASAATAILKKLGASRQLVSILEGESLINDATALTLYRFSLAAILTDSFSAPIAATQFLMISVGGIGIGLLIGFICVNILRILKDVNAETSLTIITAFASYVIAEHLGFSGVISTVVTGLYAGRNIPSLMPHTRVHARASWNTLMFVINGFVFALIGFQLPSVIYSLGSYSIFELVCYGLVMSLAVILLRVFWVYCVSYLPTLISSKLTKHEEILPWKFHLAIGWTGMRGIVSLAAVLAIPVPIVSGVSFPHRDLLIFLTYCVIVATLIVPTLTLPYFLRFLDLTDKFDRVKKESEVRIRTLNEVIRGMKTFQEAENIPDNIFREFSSHLKRRLRAIKAQLKVQPYSLLADDFFYFRKLSLSALDMERKLILKMREHGEIHDGFYRKLMEELDIEEMRLQNLRV